MQSHFAKVAAPLFALLFPAAPALAQGNDPTPGPMAGATITVKPDAQVPLDLQFSDESGQTVKLGDYFQSNRPVVLIMVYFGCTQLCGPALNGLTEAVRKIDLQPGKQFEIVTVSFNPKDGPEMAAAKKANFIKLLGNPAAAAGWHFLTNSDPAAGHALGDAIGFSFRLNPENGQYMHEAGIFLCTPEGRVSRVERGIDLRLGNAPRLARSTPRRGRSARASSAWPWPAGSRTSTRKRENTRGPP